MSENSLGGTFFIVRITDYTDDLRMENEKLKIENALSVYSPCTP